MIHERFCALEFELEKVLIYVELHSTGQRSRDDCNAQLVRANVPAAESIRGSLMLRVYLGFCIVRLSLPAELHSGDENSTCMHVWCSCT